MIKEILKILKSADNYISGQAIAEQLDVSRTTVWKNIKKLKENGYDIESRHNKGYRLIEDYSTLSKDELELLLNENKLGAKVYYFDTIDSTNDYAKTLGNQGKESGALVVADEQTKGKGRLGRTWTSEKNSGLWMSLLLRPAIQPYDALKITQIAGAAMIQTLLKITELNVKIKWPNDIVVNGKKICGILTEMNAEMNQINYVVLGIGLNMNQSAFNKDLKDKATSLFQETERNFSRKQIIKTFIDYFEQLYFDYINENNFNKSLEICRKYSAVIHQKVKLINNAQEKIVLVKNIDENGNLVVESDGDIKKVFSGEISIRGLNNKYI